MIDIFVVAGNRKQFETLCAAAQKPWKKELQNRQVHYIEDYREIDGVPPSRVFLYGTYKRRPDWSIINYMLKQGRHRLLEIR